MHIADNDKIRQFTDANREKNESELRAIVTRYMEYQPEMVEAALIISVDRGYIPYEVREKVSAQIERNILAHQKGIKPSSWEDDNAFNMYVSSWSDEEIYDKIDNPSNIVIDVYSAVLGKALERELISRTEYERLNAESRKAIRTDAEAEMDDFLEFTKDLSGPGQELSDEDAGKERVKFWICPGCHEYVDSGLSSCPRCQTEKPENPEHPMKEDIKRLHELKRPFNYKKGGITILAAGIILLILGLVTRSGWHIFRYRWDAVITGVAGILSGLIFLFKGVRGK